MRTNIDLDEELVKEAFECSGAKSKKELVNLALKEFVESRRRLSLLDLEWKIEFAEGYDYKKVREQA
jgi:Arc/MetJ family transcription regulator